MYHLAPPSFLPLNHMSSTVVALGAVVCHILLSKQCNESLVWFKASSFCYFISIEPSLRSQIPCWCPESWPSWVWLPALRLHLLQQFISGISVLLTLLIPQNDGILFCEVRCSQRSLFIWLLFWDRAEMEFLTWNLILLWTDICYYCFSKVKDKIYLTGFTDMRKHF